MPPRPPAMTFAARPRSTLGKLYAARVSAVLRGLETIEDAAVARAVEELRRLRAELVGIISRGSASTSTPAPSSRAREALSLSALILRDVSALVSSITTAIRATEVRLVAGLIAAQRAAARAGVALVDGVWRPAARVLSGGRVGGGSASSALLGGPSAAPAAPAPLLSTPPPAAATALLPAPPRPRGRAPGVDLGRDTPAWRRNPPGGGRRGGNGGSGGGNRLPPISVVPPPGGDGLPQILVEGVLPTVPTGLEARLTALAAEEMTTLTSKMRHEMAAAVRRAALGVDGITPLKAMEIVDRLLPAKVRGKRLTSGVGSSAERIVRTQMARAANAAANERMKALGVGQKQWIATLGDGRTRPDHLDAHGQTVDVADSFVIGVKNPESLAFPGDPAGSAAQVINCRCRAVAVLPDNPEDLFR